VGIVIFYIFATYLRERHFNKTNKPMKNMVNILMNAVLVALLWDDAEEVRKVGNRGGTGI